MMTQEQLQISKDLLDKYSTSGPRYTSYPTVPAWTDTFDHEAYRASIIETNKPDNVLRPLSLYTHLPFCESRCLFCGCNVVITQQRDQAEKYLDFVFREIDQLAGLMAPGRLVRQFHWGGGTPTYLSPEQMERLFRFQKERFTIASDAEIAIEIDPRVTSTEQLQLLRELGFNRISLGVQDFNPQVQQAVHRVQSAQMTEDMILRCRELGFEGINVDLIYGLPHQTQELFQYTLQEIIHLNPDRIALYHFAYVPWLSPHQKEIPESTLPSSEEKFAIFQDAINTLTRAGYIYIGMDHFAKPHDELAIARENGTLHRNFMGFTVNKTDGKVGCELYGMGVSAISGLDRYYAQSNRKLSVYYDAVSQGRFATMRGAALTDDDVLRRTVINQILCNGQLFPQRVKQQLGLDSTLPVETMIHENLTTLKDMADDGLLAFEGDGFVLTLLGRILSRNIAMLFDGYLKAQQMSSEKTVFSKTL